MTDAYKESGTYLFLSTPSARRATRGLAFQAVGGGISIHALREEGDPRAARPAAPSRHFYPRPPRGGRPEKKPVSVELTSISIHALREEGDRPRASRAAGRGDFYPRPPRGGRLGERRDGHGREVISIHALREEGDAGQASKPKAFGPFLSTPSARRATRFSPPDESQLAYFYPRPPRGGRHISPAR